MDIGTIVRIIPPTKGMKAHGYATAKAMSIETGQVVALRKLPPSTLYKIVEINQHKYKLLPLGGKYAIAKYMPHLHYYVGDLDTSWVEKGCTKLAAILKKADK